MQIGLETKRRGSRQAQESRSKLVESEHEQAEDHRQKQGRSRTVRSSIGSFRSNRHREHDDRLGLCSETNVDH